MEIIKTIYAAEGNCGEVFFSFYTREDLSSSNSFTRLINHHPIKHT